MVGITDALNVVTTTYDLISNSTSGKVDDAEKKKAYDKMDVVYAAKGDMTKLLSDFIIEPIIVISDNASRVEVVDKVAELNMNLFSSFFMQAFDTLHKIYGIDTKTAITLLSTDNGVKKMKGAMGRSLKGMLTGESANGDQITTELSLWDNNDINNADLTTEASKKRKVPTVVSTTTIGKSSYGSDDIAVSAILHRDLEIKIDTVITNAAGEAVSSKFSIPIIVRAMIYRVSLETILISLGDKRKNQKELRFLDWKAGLKSTSDLLFSSAAVKEYKAGRLKNPSEFQDLLKDRRASSVAKAATYGAYGFEKNYNCYIITEEDKKVLDSEIRGNLYNDKNKTEVLEKLNGFTISVLDEDEERINVMTSSMRGVSGARFKDLSKSKQGSTSDLTDLFNAMVSNSSIF